MYHVHHTIRSIAMSHDAWRTLEVSLESCIVMRADSLDNKIPLYSRKSETMFHCYPLLPNPLRFRTLFQLGSSDVFSIASVSFIFLVQQGFGAISEYLFRRFLSVLH